MKTTGIVLILLVATLALPVGNSFAVPVSAPPTNLAAQAVSGTQINLSWTAPVNSTQNEVTGYLIEQDINCDGTFVTISQNNTSTTYSNTGLTAGICYAYRVSALNSAGTSMPSNVDFDITHATPSAPTNLSITPSATSLKLIWVAPTSNGGASISGYQIQRNGTILVSNTNNNSTTYIDTGLKPSTTQTYRIAAWNDAGLGAFSANMTSKTLSKNGTTDSGNIGQAISDYIHKRNELFKQQREETLKIIRECSDKATNATNTQRKQILQDCRNLMHDLQEKYKEARKQLNQDFKTFRNDTKQLLKAQRGDIQKDDVKEIKHDIKDYEKDDKKDAKELKHDIKDAKKDAKKELKKDKKDDKHSKED